MSVKRLLRPFTCVNLKGRVTHLPSQVLATIAPYPVSNAHTSRGARYVGISKHLINTIAEPRMVALTGY